MPSPMKYVSFAGVSLTLSTPELEAQVNRLLPIQQWRDWDGWNFANAGTSVGQLPTSNIPVPPPLELGVLHWPNDAVRPAWFHAAVTQEVLDQINEVYTGPDDPQDLVLQDGREGRIVTAKMSMLPPRPISRLGGLDDDFEQIPLETDGWILTFTDQRFWWQWRSGSIDATPSSWDNLYASVQGLLDIVVAVEDIDSAYGVPSSKWIGYLRPPAVLLDAVAASVGQRIVVDLDGSVRAVNWENAKQSANDQSELLTVAMGGVIPVEEIGKYVPAAVNVAGIDLTTSGPGGEIVPYTEEKTLEDLEIEEYGDATGVDGAVATAFVDFGYEGASSDYAWSQLVTAAAIDWYGWRLADLDIAFPGIAPWTPTGFEDFVEWVVKLTDPWIEINNPHESLILTRVRRSPFSNFPSTILPTTGSATRIYIVNLTGTGAGIDGGTAWAGIIQEEESGSVVDNGYIGTDPDNPNYVMYPSLSFSGTSGSPAVGDRVYAIPDKDRAGVWLFIPKVIQGFECGDCGWLTDVPTTTCFKIQVQGGSGRCSCIPPEGFEASGSAVYISGFSGWVATKMKTTCCGCGGMIFKITGSKTATLTLKNFHVSCSSPGGLFTIELESLCCGVNEQNGKPYVKFRGSGAAACDGDQEPCDNTFIVTVTCYDCPDFVCGCCCTDYGPPSWYEEIPQFSFSSDTRNGFWVWHHEPLDGNNCRWAAECYGITSVVEFVDADNVVRLTHGGFVYEINRASWSCHGNNQLTYVSGSGTHPASITIRPIMTPFIILPLPCSVPDSIQVEIVAPDCPAMNNTVTATREIPGTGPWVYLVPGGLSVTVACTAFGRFEVAITTECDADPTPVAFGADTTGDPDSTSFDPLELIWTGVPITGTPPVEGCCEESTATIRVYT